MRRVWTGSLLLLCCAFDARAEGPSVVAVFDVEVTGLKLDKGTKESLSEVVFGKVAGLSGFTVIPRAELKTRLNTQKKDSYKACYDQSCQIEIGRELAASKLLSTKVLKLGNECTVSVVLYDLRTSATEGAADASGGCRATQIAKTIAQAVTQLGAKSGPAPTPVAMTIGVPDEKYCAIAGTKRMGDPWPDGQSVSCIDAQGKLQGTMLAWYPSGKLSMKSDFKDGQMEGPQTIFHQNGAILQKGDNLKGKRSGPWLSYYDDGTKMEEGEYRLGAKVGKWSRYRPDGKKDEDSELVGDLREGPSTSFHADGVTPRESGRYLANKRDGLWIEYKADGAKAQETNYLADQRHGTETSFGEDGQPDELTTWAKGQRQGLYQRWSGKGQKRRLVSEGEYLGGQKSGLWKSFADDGQVKEEERYKDGKLDGPNTEWRVGRDGTRYKSVQGEYRAGKKHGRWLELKADGSTERESTWVDGERQAAE